MVSETHLPGKADSLSALRAGMTLPALSDKESLAGSSVALLACPRGPHSAGAWLPPPAIEGARRTFVPLLNKRRLSYVAQLELANVCFRHKADIPTGSTNVRFWG